MLDDQKLRTNQPKELQEVIESLKKQVQKLHEDVSHWKNLYDQHVRTQNVYKELEINGTIKGNENIEAIKQLKIENEELRGRLSESRV